jgi:hypothetical protein
MPLFVSGCAENMGRLSHLIDEIVLLSAPVATVMKRLAARPGGGYGSGEDDRRKVRELISTIEPRLRELASHEIDTQGSTAATVDAVLRAGSGAAADSQVRWGRKLQLNLAHCPRPPLPAQKAARPGGQEAPQRRMRKSF